MEEQTAEVRTTRTMIAKLRNAIHYVDGQQSAMLLWPELKGLLDDGLRALLREEERHLGHLRGEPPGDKPRIAIYVEGGEVQDVVSEEEGIWYVTVTPEAEIGIEADPDPGYTMMLATVVEDIERYIEEHKV